MIKKIAPLIPLSLIVALFTSSLSFNWTLSAIPGLGVEALAGTAQVSARAEPSLAPNLAPVQAQPLPPPSPAIAASAHCPALPPSTGNTVNVSSVAELQNAVNNAASGDTILIADGTYDLDGAYLRITTPNVTLRSASGDREAVTLDGNYVTTEIIQVVASDVTIADLTLREAYYHPIHVTSSEGGDTLNTLIYNLHIVDPGQQAIKINPHAAKSYFPDEGEIACSHIELTDAGRTQVWAINGQCYTGGIDAHQARGWIIRDNLIEGFWCPGDGDGGCQWYDLSEHGIHLWRGCRDTLVERNRLRDNARGIGFGLEDDGSARTYPDDPCPGAPAGHVEHYDGIIRNNFIFASDEDLFTSDCRFDCGICLWQACGAQVVHNTVASTQPPFSSIEWRFEHTDVDLVNNLVSHNLRDRGGSAYTSANLENQPLSLFVDGPGGDLHLAATAGAAIDQGDTLAAGLCDADVDGDVRPIGAAPDVGADEYGLAPPAAVSDLRVTQAITTAGALTASLAWTAPADADTVSLRYADAPIDEANWGGATLLTDSLSGGTETYQASLPYNGDTVYFGLKTQNAGGQSGLSNNAFWPSQQIFLPVVSKNH